MYCLNINFYYPILFVSTVYGFINERNVWGISFIPSSCIVGPQRHSGYGFSLLSTPVFAHVLFIPGVELCGTVA